VAGVRNCLFIRQQMAAADRVTAHGAVCREELSSSRRHSLHRHSTSRPPYETYFLLSNVTAPSTSLQQPTPLMGAAANLQLPHKERSFLNTRASGSLQEISDPWRSSQIIEKGEDSCDSV
jgi:hypothetical protein